MRAASATARAGSDGVVQRLREQRDVDRRVLDRQLLELAALPDDVRRRAGAGPAPWRARARPPTDRRRSRAPPSATLRSSGSLRRSRDRPLVSGGSSRPSARDHAAQLRPGTSCRASRVSAATWVSKFSLRSRSTSCSRASSARTPASLGGGGELLLERRPERAMAVLASGRRQRDSRCSRASFSSTDQAGVLEQSEVARDARLRQAEDAGQLGHVQPLAARARAADAAGPRRRAGGRARTPDCTSLNLHLVDVLLQGRAGTAAVVARRREHRQSALDAPHRDAAGNAGRYQPPPRPGVDAAHPFSRKQQC